MKRFLISSLIIIAALPLIVSSCGDGSEMPSGPTGNSNANTPSHMDGVSFVPTETGEYSYEYANRMEMPAITGNNCVFVTHIASRYENDEVNLGTQVNYSVLYDKTRNHSRWIAYRFDKATSRVQTGRKDYSERPQYPRDPLLKKENALPDDLGFSGYDHGHLCASAERYFSAEANKQTFYMTDMSPQTGSFNQSYWTIYEKFLYSIARDGRTAPDTLYVVKGGTITEDKIINSFTSGSYRIPVPKYYFVACLAFKGGAYSAIGFWVEHKTPASRGTDQQELLKHAVSIDELERLTGFDFFCNLPDKAEKIIEGSYSPSWWGL